MDTAKIKAQLELIRYEEAARHKGGPNYELLVARYNGGGDEGYVEPEVSFDDDDVDEEFLNFIEANLDYGSWAGDFSAHGEVYWDGTEFSIQGYESTMVSADKPNFTLYEDDING